MQQLQGRRADVVLEVVRLGVGVDEGSEVDWRIARHDDAGDSEAFPGDGPVRWADGVCGLREGDAVIGGGGVVVPAHHRAVGVGVAKVGDAGGDVFGDWREGIAGFGGGRSGRGDGGGAGCYGGCHFEL